MRMMETGEWGGAWMWNDKDVEHLRKMVGSCQGFCSPLLSETLKMKVKLDNEGRADFLCTKNTLQHWVMAFLSLLTSCSRKSVLFSRGEHCDWMIFLVCRAVLEQAHSCYEPNFLHTVGICLQKCSCNVGILWGLYPNMSSAARIGVQILVKVEYFPYIAISVESCCQMLLIEISFASQV